MHCRRWKVAPTALLAAGLFAEGGPTFTKQVLTTTFYSEGANYADVDGDGVRDVISGPYWYKGPHFRTATEIYPAKPFDPAGYSDNFFCFPSDQNGDGAIDLVIVGFPSTATAWYENPRGQGYWVRHGMVEQTGNESPAFEDIDGDGRSELIYFSDGRLGWASGDRADPNRPWQFHPVSVDLKVNAFAHGLGVGDIDGDGKPDVLLATGWWKQPASLEGDPMWEFHAYAFSTKEGGGQMLVYDVDGDGLNDVVSSIAAHHHGLSWFQQKRKGEVIDFVEHPILSINVSEKTDGVQFGELHAVALADMNGDGLRDIVTGKRWWSHGAGGDPDTPPTNAVLYWWELVRVAADSVRWKPHLIDDNSGIGTQIVAGDINGDGKADVVVGNKKGTVVFLQKD